MTGNTLWSALRARLGPMCAAPRSITVQHVMPYGADLDAVQALLDDAADTLDLRFELRTGSGEIVLMDAELAERMAPQIVEAFTEGRPLVTLRASHPVDELLAQLRDVAPVRRRLRAAGRA